MTEAEAQTFMARTVVRFTGAEGTDTAFQEQDQAHVLTGPGEHTHFIDPADVVETLTVAQIAAIAAGG